MTIRTRKLLGTVLLLLLVIVWSLVAMALAPMVLPQLTGLVAGIYYIFAGLGWALIAMPLVRWMQRPDTETG